MLLAMRRASSMVRLGIGLALTAIHMSERLAISIEHFVAAICSIVHGGGKWRGIVRSAGRVLHRYLSRVIGTSARWMTFMATEPKSMP